MAYELFSGQYDKNKRYAAYLLGPAELNNDASNYWIFSDSSFRRLAERAGFSIVSSTSVFGRADKISNPVDINYGEKGFLLLRSG